MAQVCGKSTKMWEGRRAHLIDVVEKPMGRHEDVHVGEFLRSLVRVLEPPSDDMSSFIWHVAMPGSAFGIPSSRRSRR
eukprot:4813344-Pleurochrysis_carterae.AAC.1